MSQIEIGRLLRASTSGLVVGCRVSQIDAPAFGAMVRVPVDPAYQIYGLIYDIHIDDDGLVRQLITAEGVNEDVIADNRLNRNVPLEMSVLSIGYRLREQYFHAIPPRPPSAWIRFTCATPPTYWHSPPPVVLATSVTSCALRTCP